MARAHAVGRGLSLSKAVADLLRRQVSPEPPSRTQGPGPAFDAVTGFPIVETDGRPITSEDIRRSLDDDDVRHLEMMGLSQEEIQESLER